jgi:serine/threonine-protein kinase RsbW
MVDNVTISLPSKSEYVSVARLTASVIANGMGFDIEDVEDIKVAVGEACNNAVLHSCCDDRFGLNFTIHDKKFIVEVEDCGHGFNLEAYESPDLINHKGNGLGLFIMKSLMDDVQVFTEIGNGTRIVLTKYLE